MNINSGWSNFFSGSMLAFSVAFICGVKLRSIDFAGSIEVVVTARKMQLLPKLCIGRQKMRNETAKSECRFEK